MRLEQSPALSRFTPTETAPAFASMGVSLRARAVQEELFDSLTGAGGAVRRPFTSRGMSSSERKRSLTG